MQNEEVKKVESGEDYIPLDCVGYANGGKIRLLASNRTFYFPIIGEKVELIKPVKIGKTIFDEVEFKRYVILKMKGDIAHANKWEGE